MGVNERKGRWKFRGPIGIGAGWESGLCFEMGINTCRNLGQVYITPRLIGFVSLPDLPFASPGTIIALMARSMNCWKTTLTHQPLKRGDRASLHPRRPVTASSPVFLFLIFCLYFFCEKITNLKTFQFSNTKLSQ
jgi:hypothetical protein